MATAQTDLRRVCLWGQPRKTAKSIRTQEVLESPFSDSRIDEDDFCPDDFGLCVALSADGSRETAGGQNCILKGASLSPGLQPLARSAGDEYEMEGRGTVMHYADEYLWATCFD